MSYDFSQDWFTRNVDNFNLVKEKLLWRTRVLEIGSFEGRSTVWLVENFLEDEGEIVCIDTWGGSKEHASMQIDMQAVESRFDRNIATLKTAFPLRRVIKHKGEAHKELAQLLLRENIGTDLVYVDGSHEAKDCLSDAVFAWNLLKKGGVMVFDDYTWDVVSGEIHRPRMAIDAFLAIYTDEIEVLFKNHQVGIRKI
jgi:predicted O-methyltransferase YrrM